MSMKEKFKNFFYLEDEDEEEVMPPAPVQQSRQQPTKQKNLMQQQIRTSKQSKERVVALPEGIQQNNVVSLQVAASSKQSKVILVEPRVYAEAQDIAEHLKNKRSTIVNLQRIDREQGIRIIDFLSGTVYALGGDIQRIGKDIFLCAPDNVEVTGEISNFILDDFE